MYCETIEQPLGTETFNYFHIQNIIDNEWRVREFRSFKVHVAMYRFAKNFIIYQTTGNLSLN